MSFTVLSRAQAPENGHQGPCEVTWLSASRCSERVEALDGTPML